MKLSIVNIVSIAIGGGLGALSRVFMVRILGEGRPYSVAIVNLFGCFLFGYYLPKFSSPPLVNFFFLGFLGSMTTFSSFINDGINLLNHSEYLFFSLNLLGQIFFGLLLFKLGFTLSMNGKV